MPRKCRICLPDMTYQASSRCIERKPLMRQEAMKKLMLDVLAMALEKYQFELINYTIMDNHFHFYIKTLDDGETISRIMQFIKSQYARRYNRMMGRIGPFWNERFSDTIVERTKNPVQTFWHMFMYMGYNPVRSRYVADPRHCVYGGFRSYTDEGYVSPLNIS